MPILMIRSNSFLNRFDILFTGTIIHCFIESGLDPAFYLLKGISRMGFKILFPFVIYRRNIMEPTF